MCCKQMISLMKPNTWWTLLLARLGSRQLKQVLGKKLLIHLELVLIQWRKNWLEPWEQISCSQCQSKWLNGLDLLPYYGWRTKEQVALPLNSMCWRVMRSLSSIKKSQRWEIIIIIKCKLTLNRWRLWLKKIRTWRLKIKNFKIKS